MNDMKELWIVCKYVSAEKFEFQGVFSTEEKAIAACVDFTYGIGPANLDEPVPDETTEWPGFYYPTAQK